MYIDGIKLLAKNEKELETLIQIIRRYNQDKEWDLAQKMCLANYEKRKKTNNERNRNAK